jgi:hypothetical protein
MHASSDHPSSPRVRRVFQSSVSKDSRTKRSRQRRAQTRSLRTPRSVPSSPLEAYLFAAAIEPSPWGADPRVSARRDRPHASGPIRQARRRCQGRLSGPAAAVPPYVRDAARAKPDVNARPSRGRTWGGTTKCSDRGSWVLGGAGPVGGWRNVPPASPWSARFCGDDSGVRPGAGAISRTGSLALDTPEIRVRP